MQAIAEAVSRRYNLAPAGIARARTFIGQGTTIGRRGVRTAKRRRVSCDETWHEELDELVEMGTAEESSARLAVQRNYFLVVMLSVLTIEMYHYFNPSSYLSMVKDP